MKRTNPIIIMARLSKLVKPLAGYMALAVSMGTLGHLCAAFITVLGGYGILSAMGTGEYYSLETIFIIIAICALARGFLRYGEQNCNHYIAFKLLALIRDKVFEALTKLCPAKLEGKDRGNLISVITSDIELLEVFYAHTISPAAIAILFSAIICTVIGSYSLLLAVIAAAAYGAVGILVPIWVAQTGKNDGIKLRNGSGNLSAYVLDSLRGLDETIQYGGGDERLENMNRQTEALSATEKKMKLLMGKNTAVTGAVIMTFDMVMLMAAAILHMNGYITFDGALISVLALMSSFGPVVALANLGSTLQNTFAAGERVLAILDEKPQVEEINGRNYVVFEGAEGSNVCFSYGKETILKDVSLKIPKGEVIGIAGKSGSGKSTLLKLLMRFWQVNKGEVALSGRNVGDINTENLRKMESYVTQETHLFRDSIAANLRVAKPDATYEEMAEACKKASIHDFITRLPKGYDTQVGELGDTLSGGERQRIGLARAFIHGAPFMLLDEPTSNLDSLNEAVILKSIKDSRKDKTVVIVSHRLSSLKIADRIYSMEQRRNS